VEARNLVLQLRKRKISKIILGGMLANMCVESHLRELLEQGFEVAVVKDATTGPKHPEWGYGYTAALINYAFLAHAVLITDQAVKGWNIHLRSRPEDPDGSRCHLPRMDAMATVRVGARWIVGRIDFPLKPVDSSPLPHAANVEVKNASPDQDLGQMLEDGEIDALISADLPKCILQNSPKVCRSAG
jgi:hypothetical protein